ncbi:MAG: hypothetical protein DRO39_00915 [Thermoprotei archaeon]|nr:MAG: hypothetical protein DRO39_00915 [Thermoprotei archaeon]
MEAAQEERPYRSVNAKLPYGEYMAFARKAKDLGLSISEALRILAQAFVRGDITISGGRVVARGPLEILVCEDKNMKPVTVSTIAEYMIMEMVREGYSVMFNVKIDSKNGRIVVTRPNALINVITG